MSLSIGKAWEEASEFLRRELRLIVPVSLAFFAIPTALDGWISPSVPGSPTDDGSGLLMGLALLIAAMVGQMTLAGLASGWSGSVGAAMSRAFARVWGMLAAIIIVFLPIAVIAVLILAAILGGSGLTDPAQLTAEALAANPSVAMFFLVLMVVFLFAGVRLFPMSAIAFVETANPIRLLGRSWSLSAGQFLRLLGLLLLILIAALIASAAVTLPIGSIATLIAGKIQPFSLSALIVALFQGIVSAVISAIFAAMIGRVYLQLSSGQSGVPDVKRPE